MGKPLTELQGVACHMGSHNVTCHPTQVNAPHHNHSRWRLVLKLTNPSFWPFDERCPVPTLR